MVLEVVPYVAELLPAKSEDQYFEQFDAEIPGMYADSARKSLVECGFSIDDADSLLQSVGLRPKAEALLTPPNLVHAVKTCLKQYAREAVEAIMPTFGWSFQQQFGKRFGILCLTKNATSLLMWAHYADCHRGFAIGFQRNHPVFNRPAATGAVGHVLSVQYTEDRPAITLI